MAYGYKSVTGGGPFRKESFHRASKRCGLQTCMSKLLFNYVHCRTVQGVLKCETMPQCMIVATLGQHRLASNPAHQGPDIRRTETIPCPDAFFLRFRNRTKQRASLPGEVFPHFLPASDRFDAGIVQIARSRLPAFPSAYDYFAGR